MNDINALHSGDAAARSRIEALIAAYPDLAEDDMRLLLRWYRSEASSYDVAMLSARDDLRPGYERFYADHVARISPLNYALFALLLLLCGGVIYAVLNHLPH
jgi:hypothetical protein